VWLSGGGKNGAWLAGHGAPVAWVEGARPFAGDSRATRQQRGARRDVLRARGGARGVLLVACVSGVSLSERVCFARVIYFFFAELHEKFLDLVTVQKYEVFRKYVFPKIGD